MQRSLLALMVVLTMLYGCGEASMPVERVEKQHGLDKQVREKDPTELAPEPPASNTSPHDEVQKMIERACEDWDSKDMGAPPELCNPAGLSPAFCHSASRAAFCN